MKKKRINEKMKLNKIFRSDAKPHTINLARQMPNALSCTFTRTLEM